MDLTGMWGVPGAEEDFLQPLGSQAAGGQATSAQPLSMAGFGGGTLAHARPESHPEQPQGSC